MWSVSIHVVIIFIVIMRCNTYIKWHEFDKITIYKIKYGHLTYREISMLKSNI